MQEWKPSPDEERRAAARGVPASSTATFAAGAGARGGGGGGGGAGRTAGGAGGVGRWVPDDDAVHCGLCGCTFTPIVRKHHCRRCGGVFCDECSDGRMLIPPNEICYPPDHEAPMLLEIDAQEPQRTCRTCTGVLFPQQDMLRKTCSKAETHLDVDRESAERYLNLPVHFAMEAEIRKATYILYNFTNDNAIEGEDSIPRELLWGARGLAFLTVVKAGFFFTGRVGTGIVVSRLPDGGWSAPSALCCTGVGWGFQLGGEITDVVIVLNTDGAVDAFTSSTQVALGTELSVSVGPVGRTAGTDLHAGDGGVTAAFSYAHSKGFFIGVSLEASVLVSRDDVNTAFYGKEVTPEELLCGRVDRPKAAEPLYAAIEEVMSAGPSENPDPASLAAAAAAAAPGATTLGGDAYAQGGGGATGGDSATPMAEARLDGGGSRPPPSSAMVPPPSTAPQSFRPSGVGGVAAHGMGGGGIAAGGLPPPPNSASARASTTAGGDTFGAEEMMSMSEQPIDRKPAPAWKHEFTIDGDDDNENSGGREQDLEEINYGQG